MPDLRRVLDGNRDRLMAIEGVAGVAIGRSETDPEALCILVYSTAAGRPSGLPESLEGFPVEVRKTSGFRAG